MDLAPPGFDDTAQISCYNKHTMDRNLFIVIDGTDGSGKETQTDLLIRRLQKEEVPLKTISFPQYNTKSAGLIEEYLSGKYGTAAEVGPHASSIFYAVDRFDASFKIRDWLANGYTVITDRYVTANMGHQGGKIIDKQERQSFFDWNDHLEYEIFNIPRPDINIILHLPTKIAFAKLGDRGWKGDIKTDIHETDKQHLIDAEKSYLHLASYYPNTYLIDCADGDKFRSREDIHEQIYQKIISLK